MCTHFHKMRALVPSNTFAHVSSSPRMYACGENPTWHRPMSPTSTHQIYHTNTPDLIAVLSVLRWYPPGLPHARTKSYGRPRMSCTRKHHGCHTHRPRPLGKKRWAKASFSWCVNDSDNYGLVFALDLNSFHFS